MMPIQNIEAGQPSASNKIIRLAYNENHYMAIVPVDKEDSDFASIKPVKHDAFLNDENSQHSKQFSCAPVDHSQS